MSLDDIPIYIDYICPASQFVSCLFGYSMLTVTGGPAGDLVRDVLGLLAQNGVGIGSVPYWAPGEGLMLTVDDKDRARRVLARHGYEAV